MRDGGSIYLTGWLYFSVRVALKLREVGLFRPIFVANHGFILFNGRPENTDGRLLREVRTYDFLDSLSIPYLRTDHGRADNMDACNETDAVWGVLICKNLFLCDRQKTKFYLLMIVMPGDKKFKTKELSSSV